MIYGRCNIIAYAKTRCKIESAEKKRRIGRVSLGRKKARKNYIFYVPFPIVFLPAYNNNSTTLYYLSCNATFREKSILVCKFLSDSADARDLYPKKVSSSSYFSLRSASSRVISECAVFVSRTKNR